MNLQQVTRIRSAIARVCALILALLAFSILDGLISVIRQPANTYQLLPGESVEVTGPLRPEAANLSDLTYKSTSEGITLSFVEALKGFWLGGDMWRGKILVGEASAPGEHTLTVRDPGLPADKVLAAFLIKVYGDGEALRRDGKSLILRYAGFPPWYAMIALVALVLVTVGVNFLIAHKMDRLLAEVGKAEVYHIVRGEGLQEVMFGLGTDHGVRPGMPFTLLDHSGEPIYSGEIEKATEGDGMATVPLDCVVKTGYVVWVKGKSPGKPRPIG